MIFRNSRLSVDAKLAVTRNACMHHASQRTRRLYDPAVPARMITAFGKCTPLKEILPLLRYCPICHQNILTAELKKGTVNPIVVGSSLPPYISSTTNRKNIFINVINAIWSFILFHFFAPFFSE